MTEYQGYFVWEMVNDVSLVRSKLRPERTTYKRAWPRNSWTGWHSRQAAEAAAKRHMGGKSYVILQESKIKRPA